MPSTRFDALVDASHIRGYKDRIDILNHALWLVDNEMKELKDEKTISKLLTEKLKEHIISKYPSPSAEHTAPKKRQRQRPRKLRFN